MFHYQFNPKLNQNIFYKNITHYKRNQFKKKTFLLNKININNSTYKKKLYQNKRFYLLTQENGQNIL